MDIKAPLNAYRPFCRDPEIQAKLMASIRLIMDSAPAYEFRTTCADPFADDASIEAIATTIRGAACYVLQAFNTRADCLDPEFNRRQNPALSDERMLRLKRLVEPYVQRCVTR